MGLKEECTDTAYVLGRLFSLLEAIQKEANPSITTTIRDRYFNSACATPASVFPVLIKLKNSHIKKLERDKGGAKIYYEKQLTDIMGRLEEFPNGYHWSSRDNLRWVTIISSRKDMKKGRKNK